LLQSPRRDNGAGFFSILIASDSRHAFGKRRRLT
jgi:hypothetical protein